jgi:hypothetical protein
MSWNEKWIKGEDYPAIKDYKEEDVENITGLITLDDITYKLSIKSLGLIHFTLTKIE